MFNLEIPWRVAKGAVSAATYVTSEVVGPQNHPEAFKQHVPSMGALVDVGGPRDANLAAPSLSRLS